MRKVKAATKKSRQAKKATTQAEEATTQAEKAIVALSSTKTKGAGRRRRRCRHRSSCRSSCTPACRKVHESGKTKYPSCDLPLSSSMWDSNASSGRAARDHEISRGCRTVMKQHIKMDAGLRKGRPVQCDSSECYNCLSCMTGSTRPVLVPALGKDRAGSCEPWYTPPMVRCTSLDFNGGLATPTDKNQLCIKWGQIIDVVNVAGMTQAGWNETPKEKKFRMEAYRALKSKSGHGGYATAKCKVVKHTACRGADCAVKKVVTCSDICKFVKWEHSGESLLVKYDRHTCSPGLCRKYGALICRGIARAA